MNLNFAKSGGLIPAVIQDSRTGRVLMVGFMDPEAFEKTRESGLVTFFSRSKNRLWTKGESSGHFLHVEEIRTDCDQDTVLIKARPDGPVCHTGADTCFAESNIADGEFLHQLEEIIRERQRKPQEGSYTCRLLARGLPKIAQKVGEEATEVVIEGVTGDLPRLKEETADLLYHLLVLMAARGVRLDDVLEVLEKRHAGR
ncbi:MAG TPA: bifunctional phosphoribosyl-AMP cyclohydrolase/phosphoribosyl-ATP diphosphatase HisIE [bacterium]|nr:bifunctional phosphoribosyl-AMP cyclohydrolase/phosphoribosyl-ATP diphosphatase HisIE [bacterium]HQG44941.1 bifunctional phosphoribosyl-AMP cyclohydrolase/phosphoribosyl-ATP diphosphatase HisIE [bacterium]HQI48325.1 bifunctional phosphoribosyl-AMP cyclohydrolase/phosphoribosyl-ATP diphosphatase HisIE [bacterium]HQJ64168.1 bifunctional phosphoribosyl-AMP cyclohydrolase/phosphoribosyl-ATP diphosphatase HisIE [bacterium]